MLSPAQDRNVAPAGQKLDGEGCTRLQGGCSERGGLGAAEDEAAPARLWEALTAKKKEVGRKKRDKEI